MHTLRLGTVICVLLALGPIGPLAPPAAAGDDEVVQGELGRELDQAVSQATGGEFWGGVLVARKGAILLAKGYGHADYAERPNTANTLFEIASTSKQFTAAAILKLARERRLKLSDPLPKFFKGVPKDKRKITVHQLLTHTSGIGGDVGVPYDSPLSRKQYVAYVLRQPLRAQPGEKFAYCNTCYALLAAIVEKASGMSFEAYSKKKLFTPAGLEDTGFVKDQKLDRSRDSTRRGKRMPEATALDWHWSWGYRGMGGVVTTVHDLYLWDRALQSDAVLDEAMKKVYYEPGLENYACGWKVEKTDRGTRKIHHSGGVHGFACQYARYLDDQVVIAICSNGETNIHRIEQALAGLLFPAPTITARLNVGDFEPDARQIVKLPVTMAWTAEPGGEGVRIHLNDTTSGKTAATIALPRGPAEKLAHDLASALRNQPAGTGPAKGVEAGLYLQPYRISGATLAIDDGLSIMLKARYVGRGEGGERVVDERITFSLVDSLRGQWPVMVKMGADVARTLEEGIRQALED